MGPGVEGVGGLFTFVLGWPVGGVGPDTGPGV